MATFSRNVTVNWEGPIMEGKGSAKAGSGAFTLPVSFPRRIGDAEGITSPEELIAAAHASCLSMALSAGLEAAGTPPTRITTTASATIDKVGAGFKITRMRLEVLGEVPGIDQAAFAKAAEAAKEGCPVSQALKGNVPFEFDARLA